MIDSKRITALYEWFCCPQCGGKNIIHLERKRAYRCRKCGCTFKADFVAHTTRVLTKGVESG